MFKGSFSGKNITSLSGRSGGFTLLELMLVMGLATLVYSLVSYMTIQMNNTVRHSQVAFKRQELTIETAERLRWQLRCLYDRVPESASSRTRFILPLEGSASSIIIYNFIRSPSL